VPVHRRKHRSGTADAGCYIDRPGFYPAGRLDRDSEGLLLLTDDGRLQARIADPRFKMPKTYLVRWKATRRGGAAGLAPWRAAEGRADVARRGRTHRRPALWPRDPPVRFRKSVPDCWLRLTIREGRNRQVRRMTAAVGHPTLRLVRWRIGDWTLDGLAPGHWCDAAMPEKGS
jgi:23S rRNA pseudouridine2457 synthase